MNRFKRIATVMVIALPLASIMTLTTASAAGATHPSAPRHVTAIGGDNSAVVSFVIPASNGGSRITGYYVKEYGTNSAIRRCTSTRCTVLGLSNGVAYRFAVAAINRFGRSAYSPPSNVTTSTAPVATTATITYDANGGSGVMASETEPYNTTVALTLNAFTYAGYTFTGWNSKANGSGTNFTNGQLVKFNGSATFYAQWTVAAPPTTATITFNANGGTGYMAPETETLNVSATVTTNSFIRTGYTFSGWNTAANGSATAFTNAQLVQFTASATFYAQWTVAPVTVPFTGSISSNWSGYVLPTTTLDTLASAEWIVPRINCATIPNGSSATWVGIGGVTWSDGSSSGSLLQTGVNDDCVNGIQVDSGWFEIVPMTPNHEEVFSNFPVSPGNIIQATEGYVNGQWVTLLSNLSTGLSAVFVVGSAWEVVNTATSTPVGGIQGDATGTSYSGAYSVEWIEEDVTNAGSGSLFSLPNYGSVTFFNLKTSILSGWSLPNSDAYEITNSNGAPVSVPGSVVNSGFTVTYTGP